MAVACVGFDLQVRKWSAATGGDRGATTGQSQCLVQRNFIAKMEAQQKSDKVLLKREQ